MDRFAVAAPCWRASPSCGAWVAAAYELQVVALPGLSLGPLSSRFAHDVVAAARRRCSASAAPGSARRERTRLAADRRRRARLDARRDLLHRRPLGRESTADPVARRRRLPALPAARARRRARAAARRARATCRATLWVDGVDRRARASPPSSAAIVFETVLDARRGRAAGGRHRARLPAHRPGPARRRRRRAGRHRLAAGPHLGAARASASSPFWLADSLYLVAHRRRAPTSAGGWFDIGWWARPAR